MKKTPRTSRKGFLQKIEAIDNRLRILHTLGKVMPVIVLGTGVVIFSSVYLAYSAVSPDDVTELPQTGDNVVEDIAIIFPENFITLILPSDVILYSETGYLSENESIIFYAQKEGGEVVTIGSGKKDARVGQYSAEWKSADKGTYTMWAKIAKEDGSTVTTPSVIVDIM